MPNNTTTKGRGDTSPYVHQNKKLDFKIDIGELPWTPRQREFIQLAQRKDVKAIFCKGPAGTAKTILAVYTMLGALNDKKISDITYIRPIVESSANPLGHLPGTIDDKIGPYTIPFQDKCAELLNKTTVERLIREERITTQAINFLRGQHFAVKGIIVDEAQNANMRDLTTILTRIGEFTKLMILGDPKQSDVFKGKENDFTKMFNTFDDQESKDQGIHTFTFTHDDIVRSDFVKFVVKKLELNDETIDL